MKNLFTASLALFAAFAVAMPTSAPVESDSHLALRALENRAVTCSKARTDRLLFKVSMKTFQTHRKAKNPSKCIWKSDNCSKSPDNWPGLNFKPSCQRHDFGYRNTKKQKRFTKAMKKRIDQNFKKDMYKHCATKGSLMGVYCRRMADTYYLAVRKFGKRDIIFDEDKMEFKRAEPVNKAIAVRSEAVDEFDNFDGEELDPDFEGEEIPDLNLEDEDLEEFDLEEDDEE